MIEREAFREDALSVCRAEVIVFILFMYILVLYIILFVYKVGKYEVTFNWYRLWTPALLLDADFIRV